MLYVDCIAKSSVYFFLIANMYVFFGVPKKVFIGKLMMPSIVHLSKIYSLSFLFAKFDSMPSGITIKAVPSSAKDFTIHSMNSASSPNPPTFIQSSCCGECFHITATINNIRGIRKNEVVLVLFETFQRTQIRFL